MTTELGEKIPALGTNDNRSDDIVGAPIKLFSPYADWSWYITEWDSSAGTCFGLVVGVEIELGYFDLTQLAELTVFGMVPAVERDLYWEPKTISEIRSQDR